MARTPAPQFYEQRTTPQARSLAPARADTDSGLSSIARSLSQVGQALGAAADGEVQIERERQRREEDDARVYVAQNMARVRQQANEIRRNAFDNAEDGWRGATDTVGSGFKDVAGSAIENAPTEAARAFMGQALSIYQTELLDTSAEMEQTARRQWRVDGFTSATETFSSVLAADPEQYPGVRAELLETIRTATDLSADQRRDMEARAEEALATATMSGLVERDPHGALRMLRDPEAQGAVTHLNGQQRNALVNQAQAEINRRESEARARQAQAQASLRDTVAAQNQLLSRGIMPSQPVNVSQVAALLGPDVAQNYLANLASASAAQAMTGMSLAQVAQVAAGSTAEGSDTDRLITREQRVAAQSVLTARREDPAGYALQNGQMRHGDLLSLLGNATQGGGAGPLWDTFDAALRDRGADAVELRRTGVTDRIAVLSAGEAAALTQFLAQQSAQSRLGFFSRAQAAMNPEAYTALMGQLSPEGDNGVTAFAGYIYGQNTGRATADGRTIARTLLQGQEALRGAGGGEGQERRQVLNMPPEDQLRLAFIDRVGAAYEGQPQAQERAYTAFRAYYAGLTEQAGDASGALNSDRARRSVAVGTGGTTDWAGRETLLPWGMSAQQFSAGVRAGFQRWSFLEGEDPSQYQLRPRGGGRYQVFNGDAPLRNPVNGRDVVIQVSR